MAAGARRMRYVILAAGHSSRIERDLESDANPESLRESLRGYPKALLPLVSGPPSKCILDLWWDEIQRQDKTYVQVVTNAHKFERFRRWATAKGFDETYLVNDGTTRLGAVADLQLALRRTPLAPEEDVLVVAGDMVFCEDFDLNGILRWFRRSDCAGLLVYFDISESQCVMNKLSCGRGRSAFGIVTLGADQRVIGFKEKPELSGGMEAGLQEYLACVRHRKVLDRRVVTYVAPPLRRGVIRKKGGAHEQAHARVGLAGNPSDGFRGKTLSLTIENFWVEVTIEESDVLELMRHPIHDPTRFGSLDDLCMISSREGYQGGLRLLQSTCKKFSVVLAMKKFRMSYETNIPRQVGLAGSSGIVTATLRCLMEFYEVSDRDIPKEMQPTLVLNVELEELSINAGLQDRVVQVYEGLVYMDFTKEVSDYVQMDLNLVPPLWLAYCAKPSDSGVIHRDVRQLWDLEQKGLQAGGEMTEESTPVTFTMREFGACAARAKDALLQRDRRSFGEAMCANFRLRQGLYQNLGDTNMEMIGIAQSLKVPVKFPGSGGAVVGLMPDDGDVSKDLRQRFVEHGYVFVPIIPHGPAAVGAIPSSTCARAAAARSCGVCHECLTAHPN